MKGSVGIIVAAFLGLVALVLNWYYLYSKTSDIKTVDFIGIKTPVRAGDVLLEEHFEPVPIPVREGGVDDGRIARLREYAYSYADAKTVANIKATRDYQPGDLVLRRDYRTPKPELDLEHNERLLLIAVDGRNFVPELVDPGNEISFIVPRFDSRSPTPAGADGGAEVRSDVLLEANEMIGPFTVASLGSRLGSADVTRANRGVAGQERIVGIRVMAEGNQLERKAMLLLERLEQSSGRNVQVVLHPRPVK
jgi:hypothetical protein